MVPFDRRGAGVERPRAGAIALARLAEHFAARFAADFAEHGDAVIETVRRDDPVAYLRFAAAFAPKDIPPLDPLGGITDLELTDMIEDLRARIADERADGAADGAAEGGQAEAGQ